MLRALVNPAGRHGNLPLQARNFNQNYRKICTAVQLKMDCGATIYAPQCKFISTAVRFLTLFSMDFPRVWDGFPHVTNLLKNGGYENWNRTQKIFFGKSSFVQIFYRIFAHLEFSIIKISIHLLKKLTTSHREREKLLPKPYRQRSYHSDWGNSQAACAADQTLRI